jgi:toxin CcdB
MARFDVYRNKTGPSPPFLLDVQSSHWSGLRTRVVVPLMPASILATLIPRLNPVFRIEGEPHVMVTTDLVGVDMRVLGEIVASLGEHHVEIVDALDFLFQGY